MLQMGEKDVYDFPFKCIRLSMEKYIPLHA